MLGNSLILTIAFQRFAKIAVTHDAQDGPGETCCNGRHGL